MIQHAAIPHTNIDRAYAYRLRTGINLRSGTAKRGFARGRSRAGFIAGILKLPAGEGGLLPVAGQLHLLVAPRRAASELIGALAARLALSGSVRVLDGGNCFDAYAVARAVRRQTAQLDAVLGNVLVARAFTCFQMAALLGETPSSNAPVLALDLLGTFGDENVPAYERLWLLDECLGHLRRLAQSAPVLMSASPASPFLPPLEQAADQVWRLEEAEAEELQRKLF